MTECEELSFSDDAIIKVAQRTNVTTKPLMDQWVDTMYDNGARKAPMDNTRI